MGYHGMYVNSRRRPAGVRSQVSKLHQLNHLYFRPGIDKFKNREEKSQSDQILFWSTGCTNGFKISIALLLNIHFEQPGCALKKDASPRLRYYAMIIKLYCMNYCLSNIHSVLCHGKHIFWEVTPQQEEMGKKAAATDLPESASQKETNESHLRISFTDLWRFLLPSSFQ